MKTFTFRLTCFLLLPAAGWAQMVSTVPARHALSAPATSPLTFTFSQAVSAANAATIKVFGNQRRGLRPGTASGGGSTTIQFQPTQAFAPGEQVRVTVPAGAAGAARVYEFTTAAAQARAIFTTANISGSTSLPNIAVGDVDNDNDLDLIGTANSGATVYTNDGQGQFTQQATPINFVNPSVGQLQLVDVNNDGNLDLLVPDDRNLYIMLGSGTGTFVRGATLTLPTSTVPNSVRPVVTTADLNGDGYLDLSVLSLSSNSGGGRTLSVWVNNQNGTFTAGYTRPAILDGRLLTCADVDEDGDMDLVGSVCSTGVCLDNKVGVLLNNGAGQFTPGLDAPINSLADNLVTGDFNGDGHVDLAAPSRYVASFSLLLGTGTGGFQPLISVPTLALSTHLSAGDLDGDGDLDLLVTNDRGITQLARNNGAGSFTMTTNLLTTRLFTSAYPVDLNGDGALDIITGNGGSPGGFNVFYNTLAPLASRAGGQLAGVELYPNPAHGYLELQLPPTVRQARVELFNAVGQRRLSTVAASVGAAAVRISLTGLAPGLYVARIGADGSTVTRQLVVE